MFLFLINIIGGCSDVQVQKPPISAKNDTIFIHIPAGKYPIGAKDDPMANQDEGPYFFVHTEGFYLSETEVSNAQYANFLNDIATTWEQANQLVGLRGGSLRPTEIAFTGKRYRPSFGYEQHPVSTISYKGAVAYCEWLDATLPSEFEWEIAAKGKQEELRYTWGSEEDSSKANIGEQWVMGSKMPTRKIKSYAANGFGLYDMVGNVAEMTSSDYQPYPSVKKEIQLDDKKRKVVRGGDWYSTWEAARLTARRAIPPSSRGVFDGAVGFRCMRKVR